MASSRVAFADVRNAQKLNKIRNRLTKIRPLSARVDRLHHLPGNFIDFFDRTRGDLLVNEGGDLVEPFLHPTDQRFAAHARRHAGESLLKIPEQVGLVQQIRSVRGVAFLHDCGQDLGSSQPATKADQMR